MYETIMRFGGHRIDYLNRHKVGTSEAFGFYVLGDTPSGLPYSLRARYHLFAGLTVIKNEIGPKNLVAIYLDVNDPTNLNRPAYRRMKEDMRAGMFRRLFVFVPQDLLSSPEACQDLENLYRELNGFELITVHEDPQDPGVVSFEFCRLNPEELHCICATPLL